MLYKNTNEQNRQQWLRKVLSSLPTGARILDAGAGELRNKALCTHLNYLSQDFCEYEGVGDKKGFQTNKWDTSKIDIVSDITNIPLPSASVDAILCSEVLEHVPSPSGAVDEFSRLLRPGGVLILTAPFSSLVHFAPYHFATGFSRYWYEHHLPRNGFEITEMTANGDYFSLCYQEIWRLGNMARRHGDWAWPIAYCIGLAAMAYFKVRSGRSAEDVACFGWHCVARKKA